MELEVGAGKIPASPPAKTWIGRVVRYAAQRFPLFPNVAVVCGQFVVNYLVIARFFASGSPRPIVPLDLVLGAIIVCGFLFLLRTTDEIKDYAGDAVNFPDRPLVSGVLTMRDIRITVWVTVALLCALAVPFVGRPVFWAFLFTMIYSLLAFKWFFCEKAISNSLPLALLTHNPLVYVYQALTLSFFLGPGEWPLLPAVLYLLGDGMTGTAWEVARKIRGTEQEDAYTTYSKIWGPLVPNLIVLGLFAGAATLMGSSLAQRLDPLRVALFLVPAIGVAIAYAVSVLRFVRDPRRAPKFQLLAESFKASTILAAILALVFHGA